MILWLIVWQAAERASEGGINWALIAITLQAVAYIAGAIYTLWMRQIVKDIADIREQLTGLVKELGTVQGELKRMNGGHHGR